jgi:hypothetical protein
MKNSGFCATNSEKFCDCRGWKNAQILNGKVRPIPVTQIFSWTGIMCRLSACLVFARVGVEMDNSAFRGV